MLGIAGDRCHLVAFPRCHLAYLPYRDADDSYSGDVRHLQVSSIDGGFGSAP